MMSDEPIQKSTRSPSEPGDARSVRKRPRSDRRGFSDISMVLPAERAAAKRMSSSTATGLPSGTVYRVDRLSSTSALHLIVEGWCSRPSRGRSLSRSWRYARHRTPTLPRQPTVWVGRLVSSQNV